MMFVLVASLLVQMGVTTTVIAHKDDDRGKKDDNDDDTSSQLLTEDDFNTIEEYYQYLLDLHSGPNKGRDERKHKNKEFIQAKIKEAFYADLDGDGHQDDVRLEIKIKFGHYDHKDMRENGIDFTLIFSLQLPSGLTYYYAIDEVTYHSKVYFTINLLNHATEDGWYIAKATVIDPNGGEIERNPVHQVVFDPPGGSDGDDPTMTYFMS